jgi:hypothetical protein
MGFSFGSHTIQSEVGLLKDKNYNKSKKIEK